MKSIADVLQNHPVPGIRLSETRRTCAAAASTLAKYRIDPKKVQYKGTTLFFSVPSVVKTELIVRAEDLKKILAAAGIVCTAIK